MNFYYLSVIIFILLLEKTACQDENKQVFSTIAKTTKTDKITAHRYDLLYDEFFSPAQIRRTKKILEIGLGCNMDYGPGESAIIWPRLFPDAKVYFIEYNSKCVEKHIRLDCRFRPTIMRIYCLRPNFSQRCWR